MPVSSLRSKTGCLKCRMRRKKCGEERPRCLNCTRLGLLCRWDTPAYRPSKTQRSSTSSAPATSRPLPLVCYQTDFLSSGYRNFQHETDRQLVEYAVKFASTCFGAETMSEDEQSLLCMTVVLENEWIRDALCAFSASVISPEHPALESRAFTASQSALRRLRTWIALPFVDANDTCLLTSAFFLGLLEVSTLISVVRQTLTQAVLR